MAANKRKILETARKLAQKGAKDKALKEYQKLVKLDPKDAKLRLEIGDAYRRWGQVEDAIDTYAKVADQYTKEGFDARAVAVFKQILNLDPSRYESYQPLAELYERMGLTSEAIGAFQTAADGFHKQGKKREALELLRRMATIDPTNTTSRIKVAELLRQEELHSEAILEYDQVAKELERQGDVESSAKVYKRILEIEPDRVDALVRLARNLLARGSAAEAEPFASRALEIADNEPNHFEVLAEVYRAQHKEEEMAGVYRRLAELYRERGDEDRARDIQQRYVPAGDFSVEADDDAGLASDPLESGGLLADAEGAGGEEILLETDMIEADPSSSFSGGIPALETDELLSDPIGIPDLEESATPLDPVLQDPPQPAAASAPPFAADVDAEQLLAEASVYLRYGKRDKAVAHLEQILTGEPDHRLALEKLGEAYVESGENDRAVEFFMRSVKRAQEDEDEAAVEVLRARIAALDPSAAASLDPQPEPLPDPEFEESLEEESFSSGEESEDSTIDAELDADAIEIDIDVEDDLDVEEPDVSTDAEAPSEDEPLDAAPGERGIREAADSSISGASLSSAATQQVRDDLEEADFYMQQGLLGEAEEIYQRVLAVAPNHPCALARLGEIAAERGADPIATDSGPVAAAPAPPLAEETCPEVEDEILVEEPDVAASSLSDDLADLDIDDDFDTDVPDEEPVDAPTEDAADASEDDATDTEAELERAAEPEPPVAEEAVGIDESSTQESEEPVSLESPVPPVSEADDSALGDGFDLAAELSDAFDDVASSSFRGGAPDDGFSAVFEAFKQGVSQTVSEGDSDTHYDLGIAYKEMGLLDDAIQEFRVAMKSPSRRAECLHLVGLCALDAGRPQLAVENFTEQLEMPDLSDEHKLAGRFELGRAYQAMGDLARARSALEAVAAVDPDFCGVGELIEALAADPTSSAAPQHGDNDGYETFDDVVSEAAEDEDEPDPDPGETFDDLVEEANADESDSLDDEEAISAEAPASNPAATGAKRKKKKISFV